MNNKIQIGVMGSAADTKYSKQCIKVAERIGELIAQNGCILLFGAEKDVDSLSTAASRGAKRFNGLTVGITYEKGKKIIQQNTDVVIATGLVRGGGRELVLALSCDAIIAISGGSGTLNELLVAYQADIPTIALTGYGGWSDKLAGKFFDDRKRRRLLKSDTPEDAVVLAISEAQRYKIKYEK